MNERFDAAPGLTRLVDIVFPGDTNHRGTLFGGAGLAHMDKVAFITATRHAHVDFVTASCERIDFDAPARLGDIVDLTGRVARVGRRSLSAEVELIAEFPLSGERRRCARGVFNMVAIGEGLEGSAGRLPPLPDTQPTPDGDLRMVDMVFPEYTSHYGSLYGGHALAAMGKAAFIAATRHCRKTIVMASSRRVDFTAQIYEGEIMELIPRVAAVGRSSLTVEVDLWAENLRSGVRRACGSGEFIMVAVDAEHRPTPILSPPAA
jgi:acyl-CoA hydrolase